MRNYVAYNRVYKLRFFYIYNITLITQITSRGFSAASEFL